MCTKIEMTKKMYDDYLERLNNLEGNYRNLFYELTREMYGVDLI